MMWETVRFGDLYAVEARNGLTKPSRVRGSGYKMINMGELFANDRIYDIPMELVPLTEREKRTAAVERGDLLFARQSLVLEGAGKCSIVMEVSDLTVFESHLIRVRLDPSRAVPMFYYYYLRSPFSPVKTIVTQCAQAGIRGSDLQALEVWRPPAETQARIASVLSAYDDLAENGRKQIRLLEEAVRRLYREWFVDLRFPGRGSVPVTDGVPEGWRRGRVAEIAEFRRGRTITKARIADGGVPVVAGGLEPAYYHNQANTTAPVVTVSGSGANAGFTRLYHRDVFASDCSFADRAATPYVYFLYCFLKESGGALDALQKGSAQPHVYAKDINMLPLLIPSGTDLEAFTDMAAPMFFRMRGLEKQISLAIEARDRLLPKLISGEIAV